MLAGLFLGFALSLVASAAWGIELSREPLQPIPDRIAYDAAKARLGESLFFDPRLSRDGRVSCAHCHDLHTGGADDKAVSLGVRERRGVRNAPTVFNAALNIAQFWDGRARTLEAQIDGPLHNPREMDMSWSAVLDRLRDDASYRRRFERLYVDGITAANVRNAIAEFERSLLTPGSRFDRYLMGDETAIDAQEKRGYALFKRYGCTACHQGSNVGGNMFQRLGVFESSGLSSNASESADLGRFLVTGKEEDRHVFKVPSLRLVVCTPPYLHDGSRKNLTSTIQLMARSQLGREIPREDIAAIIRFLRTLPGRYRGCELTPKGEDGRCRCP